MDKKVKKIGVRYVLAWIFGVLFIVAGAAYLPDSIFGGLLWLIAGIIILPAFSKFIKKKYNIHLSGWLLFIIFLVLIGVGTSFLPSSKEKISAPTSPQVTVETPKEESVVIKKTEEIEKAKPKLEIISSNDYIKLDDYLFIVGEVENKGNKKAEYAKVNVRFYKDGTLIDTDYTYVDNTDISSGKTDTFKIMWNMQDYDEYKLFVSCNDC